MSFSIQARAFVPLGAVVVAVSSIAGQDWPQWRGPARDGAMPAFVAPKAWPDRLTQAWKVPVGIGHSSPIVSGGRAYLHARDGEREVVSAFDVATGRRLWQHGAEMPYQMNPAAREHGKGPKSTPVISGGRLYTFGIAGTLSCLDAASGRLVWQHDFKGQFPQTSPEFGTAMSPAVDGGMLIAHVGGPGDGALTAFDTATGAVTWSWKGDGPGYASPVVASFGGVRQVVTQTQTRVVGVAAAEGRLLWSLPLKTPYEQNSVTPLVHDGMVVLSGLQNPTIAVRPVRQGDAWTTQEVWRNAGVSMYMNSPVVSDGVLYGLSNRNKGQLFAIDAQTGATLWTSEGRLGDNAALVHAGPLLFILTTEGELIAASANRVKFEPLKRYDVATTPTWAHPAPVRGGILIKDLETLALWRF
ncbi:MAG: PQQ-like beta-propeller repeat protein [Acidobacteria bacterium]|nr:PQQ-like beta-propeller repeat protein [Acidobacteriota bacterium]